MEPPEGEWLTVAQAARTLGLRSNTLWVAGARGRLCIYRRPGQVALVSVQEVERYRREHLGKTGRPQRHDPTYEPSRTALAMRRYRERKRAHD